MKKQAPEIIAFYLGRDITDVKDGRYQRYSSPAVYVCGDDYYCSPTPSQKLPFGFEWVNVGTEYGRTIYKSSASN